MIEYLDYLHELSFSLEHQDVREFVALGIGVPPFPTEIYAFVPLPLEKNNSIRLSLIMDNDPEDDNASISCELHLGLTNDPYVALSYV